MTTVLRALIEESLIGYRLVAYERDDGTTGRRMLVSDERATISRIVASEVDRASSHETTNKVAVHRLLSVLSFTGEPIPSDDPRPTLVAEAVNSVFDKVPDELLYAAIDQLVTTLIHRVGPVNVNPLEEYCIASALLETIGYVEKVCERAQAELLRGGSSRFARGQLANEIMALIAGIR